MPCTHSHGTILQNDPHTFYAEVVAALGLAQYSSLSPLAGCYVYTTRKQIVGWRHMRAGDGGRYVWCRGRESPLSVDADFPFLSPLSLHTHKR